MVVDVQGTQGAMRRKDRGRHPPARAGDVIWPVHAPTIPIDLIAEPKGFLQEGEGCVILGLSEVQSYVVMHYLLSLARPGFATEQRRDVFADGRGHVFETEHLVVGLLERALILLPVDPAREGVAFL